MIRLCLVDDHELLLKGLAMLVDAQPDFHVVQTCSSGKETIDFLANHPAIDLLLLDVNLPDIEPDALLAKIREVQPALPIIYLTILRGLRVFHRLEKFSFQGYLLKDTSYDELFEAIRVVSTGGTYYSKRIDLDFARDQSIHESNYVNRQADVVLSKREKEILNLICQEYSSAQIAEKLFISVSTVDTHRQNIMIKLGVSNTVGLVKYAINYKLIESYVNGQ
ncbi:response regulator transcription factor [Spirosoma aerolatum]|uniref:response regulator transcription factor n=1 Tax=Spirosoma aerolatum TaxID=1211326 RepID=UPI0009ABB741|nr:response regulator transcription factor [Spirosoma aerolatum]